MSDLAHTSVPDWAVAPPGEPLSPDPAAAAVLLVGIGASAAAVTDRWRAAVACRPPSAIGVIRTDEAETAASRLRDALADATVGVRVLVAGPVGACLTVRGAAFNAGLEDDEILLNPVGAGPIDLFCVHCRRTTAVVAAIDDVVPCTACGRDLLVYHHVSRSTGRFLGFMVDAEDGAA